jgi:hypothetical protein
MNLVEYTYQKLLLIIIKLEYVPGNNMLSSQKMIYLFGIWTKRDNFMPIFMT